MSRKTDIELALHVRRYGELIRYLDKRIDVVSQAVDRLIEDVKGKKPKKGECAMLYFLKALKVMGVVAEWLGRALEDGKVTAKEAAELGIMLAGALGLPTEIDLTTLE